LHYPTLRVGPSKNWKSYKSGGNTLKKCASADKPAYQASLTRIMRVRPLSDLSPQHM